MKMRAVSINGITPANEVCLTGVDIPKVKSGWVLVKVRAFGLNHSEQVLRLSEVNEDYIQKPVIPGIECVGEIEDPSDTDFEKGQKVVALMGGMGRSFNGSYAEYALLPAHHVFKVTSSLDWDRLAVVPETYFTAWGSLFECLKLTKDDTLLVRGATCALGYVAIDIAKALGCNVIATTHRESKMDLIRSADEQILDEGSICDKVSGVTKVLELVGAKTLKDSLLSVKRGGIVCHTGILGGEFSLNGFSPINDIPNGVYLTGFYSNYPSQEVMDEIFNFIEAKKIIPSYGASYKFDDIREACIAMDDSRVNGKIVIRM